MMGNNVFSKFYKNKSAIAGGRTLNKRMNYIRYKTIKNAGSGVSKSLRVRYINSSGNVFGY